MSFNPYYLLSPNIKMIVATYKPSTATAKLKVLLNANENALGSPLTKWYNRYNEHYQDVLKQNLAAIKAVKPENILPVNSPYQSLDLLLRCFCEAENDFIIVCTPGNELLEKTAQLQNIKIHPVPLLEDFQLDMLHLESIAHVNSKIVFITSPNHIGGNSLNREDIEIVLNNFAGLVVIDETYINFSKQQSFTTTLSDYPNLVVLQNFDAAWGLAGLCISTLLASDAIINILQAVNLTAINTPAQELLQMAMQEVGMVNDMIKELVQMRAALKAILAKFPFIEKVYPSDANFLLVKFTDAACIYHFLVQKLIAVKDVSDLQGCDNCLRITIGTEEENTTLIEALVDYYDEVYKQ